MLEDLAKVQASPTELQQYVRLTSLQNKGLKRFREQEISVEKLKRKTDNEEESDSVKRIKTNSIKGSRKKRLAILDSIKQEAISKLKLDPNTVYFEVSLN